MVNLFRIGANSVAVVEVLAALWNFFRAWAGSGSVTESLSLSPGFAMGIYFGLAGGGLFFLACFNWQWVNALRPSTRFRKLEPKLKAMAFRWVDPPTYDIAEIREWLFSEPLGRLRLGSGSGVGGGRWFWSCFPGRKAARERRFSCRVSGTALPGVSPACEAGDVEIPDCLTGLSAAVQEADRHARSALC